MVDDRQSTDTYRHNPEAQANIRYAILREVPGVTQVQIRKRALGKWTMVKR